MGVYQRDERWMVYWKENGKRRDKSFGRGDEGRQLAEAFEAAVNDSRVIDGMVIPVQRIEVPEPVQLEPVVVQEPEEDKGITFGELSKKYLEHLKVSGKTETHILTLAHLLKFSFFDILDKNKPVDSMSYVEDGMKFIKHYQGVSKQTGKPRAQTTVNRYCNYLAAIFNFGIENELSKVNPLSKRKKARERPRDVQLTVKDMGFGIYPAPLVFWGSCPAGPRRRPGHPLDSLGRALSWGFPTCPGGWCPRTVPHPGGGRSGGKYDFARG